MFYFSQLTRLWPLVINCFRQGNDSHLDKFKFIKNYYDSRLDGAAAGGAVVLVSAKMQMRF